MDKPTTNWPSDSAICVRPDGSEARMSLEEMAAEALVVPDTRFPLDGEWHPENAALRQAAGASSALANFCCEQQNIEIEIRRDERRYQETGNATIAFDDAVALAERIKNLRLLQSLILDALVARKDYIAFRAGRCLTLKEGQASGTVYAALASLEATWPAHRRGWWLDVTLAIPAEIRLAGPAEIRLAGPDATFGVQTDQWLRERCEPLARELAFPPDSPAARMFDGGSFAFSIGLTPPDRDAVPVVPAPDEATIREYIKRAASCPDHWDALEVAVKVLRQCGQPLGDPLTDWVVQRSGRSNGRKAAKAPAHALRNHAIIAAVRALERCGIPPTRNRDKRWLARAHGWEGAIDSDYNPPSGSAIVAEAFGMKATAVEKVLS